MYIADIFQKIYLMSNFNRIPLTFCYINSEVYNKFPENPSFYAEIMRRNHTHTNTHTYA